MTSSFHPRRLLTALGLTVATAASIAAFGPATAIAGSTVHGCPYGALCLYRSPNWNNYTDKPSDEFAKCGKVFGISGYDGYGSYVDNQYGSVTTYFYTGHGTGVFDHFQPFKLSSDDNLKPVNSVKAC